MKLLLEVKDVKKSYGAIKAADGVTVSVGRGQIVGVTGPNGQDDAVQRHPGPPQPSALR